MNKPFLDISFDDDDDDDDSDFIDDQNELEKNIEGASCCIIL